VVVEQMEIEVVVPEQVDIVHLFQVEQHFN
jgi:hypothetical protein